MGKWRRLQVRRRRPHDGGRCPEAAGSHRTDAIGRQWHSSLTENFFLPQVDLPSQPCLKSHPHAQAQLSRCILPGPTFVGTPTLTHPAERRMAHSRPRSPGNMTDAQASLYRKLSAIQTLTGDPREPRGGAEVP